MTALYLHWPFCRKKCPYCDFNSHVRAQVEYNRWQKALIREMQSMAERMSSPSLSSIFFGGGTPSLMPSGLVAALLDEAKRLWEFAQDIEITLEANPTSSEAEHFCAYRQAGVNRLSLGVQALNAEDLRFLGREHSAQEALEVVALAASIFPRYSFDLIYARPHQTPQAWETELKQALSYARGHLSLYQLTIEPDTPFARFYAAGGFTLPDAEQSAILYEVTEHCCRDAGLEAYEISNYAAPGQESRHNLAYWRGEPYIGVGPGAHGRLYTAEQGWVATSTLKSPERWLAAVEAMGHGIEQEERLDAHARAEEILLGGLRLREGISLTKVAAAIDTAKLTLLGQQGLLEHQAGQLKITSGARLVTERIISELLTV